MPPRCWISGSGSRATLPPPRPDCRVSNDRAATAPDQSVYETSDRIMQASSRSRLGLEYPERAGHCHLRDATLSGRPVCEVRRPQSSRERTLLVRPLVLGYTLHDWAD